MNFVFISPQFPLSYWNFCDRLKNNGVNVLGIGDQPYDTLPNEVKNSLTEYYYVNNMMNYDEMVRACGFFTHKYGKIDWLESNNEFWLNLDARLRSDFNITTGVKADFIENYQNKELMKKFYAAAGVPTARCHNVDTYENGKAFIEECGYPVVVKPVVGVGAAETYKLSNDDDLAYFYATKPNVPYLMEEFVYGDLISFDGIVNQDGDVIFCTNHEFPIQIMDVVNEGKSVCYWGMKDIPEDLFKNGSDVLKAFGVRGRFFHCEYFRLTQAKKGLGEVGDIVGLEVNMRPPGGYTPDMMNFGDDVDVYKIWADMVCYNIKPEPNLHKKYVCVNVGRRDNFHYQHSHEDVMQTYASNMVMQLRMPEVLSGAMGNEVYFARFETMDEVHAFCNYVMG